jgi:hypothetical protein
VAAGAIELYLFPFETKPYWKFKFLEDLEEEESHRYIIAQWEVPENFDCEKMRDEESLPKHWLNPKKKIFHLVLRADGIRKATLWYYAYL